MNPVRIISLVPSVTETLVTWGIEPTAVTRFCEMPNYLSVGGTKNPDIEAIVALAPDLVVMNTEENRHEDAQLLLDRGLQIHATKIETIDDLSDELDRLANAVGVTVPRLNLGPSYTGPMRRAFVPIWRRPWMTIAANTYGASLLARVGWQTVAPASADRYPECTLDDVRALQPDVVLVPSEPYAFRPEHVVELATVAPVQLVDGKDLFWWGVRTPHALSRLAALDQTLRR